jgi:glycosyltransferase involved in cell wall biosynthesis
VSGAGVPATDADGRYGAAEDGSAPLSIAILGDPGSVHVRRWVEFFAGRGHRITLLVPRGQAVEPAFPREVAIERYSPNTTWRVSQLGLIATGLSVRRAIRRIKPDLLHVHYLTVNGLRAWMTGFHPCVITVWGNDVLVDPPRSFRARVLARLSLRSADLVTGISRHVVDAAVRYVARPERCRVVHFGVDVDLFSPGSASPGLRESLGLAGRRVLFSPRIVEGLYRHDVVIDALAKLPEDVVLVMTRYAASVDELAALERRVE